MSIWFDLVNEHLNINWGIFLFYFFFKEIRAYQFYLHARGAKSNITWAQYVTFWNMCHAFMNYWKMKPRFHYHTHFYQTKTVEFVNIIRCSICNYVFHIHVLEFFVQIIYFKRIFSLFIFLLITVTWIKWRNLISWFFNNND